MQQFLGNMASICFYFQVHQPYRVKPYGIFDIAYDQQLFDTPLNRTILDEVADHCYLPANQLLYELIQQYEGRFKVAFSITGVALAQFGQWRPDVIESFQRLVATGNVELLAETYHHSLSSLYSEHVFKDQLAQHTAAMQHYFGVTPTVFRNTELIYSNQLAMEIQQLGYKGILAEGIPAEVGQYSVNCLRHPPQVAAMPLLLRNYSLSDAIAFRFSDTTWNSYPLTAADYVAWLHQEAVHGADTINIFLDYETFGAHQTAATGIFDFLRALPAEVFRYEALDFKTPSEVIATYPIRGVYDVPSSSSWADTERDLSAWCGNALQKEALRRLYAMEAAVYHIGDAVLLADWHRLTTSDHYYYMCTKNGADGAVHQHFSPYKDPLQAYTYCMNAYADLEYRIEQHIGRSGIEKLVTIEAPS